MKTASFTYCKDTLPDILPIFPLNGVLLLPCGHLPLNIFEPRYIAMVDDALRSNRLIGMVQPKNINHETGPDDIDIFTTGCAGKITEFSETTDGRYLITLTGICRFNIKEELPLQNGYRKIRPHWTPFISDLEPAGHVDMDRNRLKMLLKEYFSIQELSCDWDMIEDIADDKLISCLSMICPFEPREKQALLEAPCCQERIRLFLTMLEIAIHNEHNCDAHH